MKRFLFFLLCAVTSYLLSSCEKEEHFDGKGDKPLVDIPKDTIQEKFLPKWDALIDDSNDNGDIFIGTQYLGIQGWSHLATPPYIYIGAVFPESEFGKNFSKELLYPRNPIDISTSFPDSYIGEITKETGGLGYKKFLKDVLKSSEYKKFTQNGGRESLDFQCTEYFSYTDIEKAFSSNAGLAKIFSAKVQSNSRKTNIKSRLLGQLISRNFTVTMEVPANGFFKDKSKDTSAENPVYVRSISYGKIALLAIESEYSFEEVKKAVEAGVKWKIFSAGGNFSSKDTEILQKSTITLYLISDDTSGEANQFFNSLDDIKNAFKINYSESNFGLPIFCKGYYTKDNSLFTITTSSSSRNPSVRPGGGIRPRPTQPIRRN